MPTLLAYWPIAAGIVTLYILQQLWIEYSHRQRARALGCKAPFLRQGKLPLSVDHLYKALKALKEDEFLNLELRTHADLGGLTTFHQASLGRKIIMTTDPENIKAMLATQFKDFGLGPIRYKVLEPLLGRGIFTSDGKDWQHSRAILRPQFSRTQISNLDVEEIHVQHLLNRLEHDADNWTKEVNLAPLFFNLTLDSATEFLFGKSVNTQVAGGDGGGEKADDEDMEDWSSFGQAFDSANRSMTRRFFLMSFYYLHNPSSMRRDCAEVRRFADYYVQRALARSPPPAAEEEDGTEYVFLNELAKETRDPEVLRNQLLNILLAGRDTTAGLLGWATLRLARQPAAYARLRAAVLADFGPFNGSSSSSADDDGTSRIIITFETLKACTYLQHVLSETLRLHPSVPANFRRALRDTTLPRGGGPDGQSPVYVRAGSEIAYSTNVMHRRPDLWGPDAAEFRPERWEGMKVGWEYLPFNGGPRICLGQQFALTEAAYVLVRLVQKYDLMENLDPDPVIKSNLTLTSSPVQTLVRLHEAAA
ncbi:hypothetical protein MY11210_009503 [Beauveria gryllotalpidicola]